MPVLLTAIACFVGGFVFAWVLVWTAATRAMSRQSERNLRHIGELNARLRTLQGVPGTELETAS